MGVTDQLGLYDVAAHVIPGVVVLSAAGWAVAAWTGLVPPTESDLLVATLGGVAAYVAGVLCQEVGGLGRGILVKRPAWAAESQESAYLAGTLAKGGPLPEFRERLEKAILDRTGLDPAKAKGAADPARWRETCFRACYAVVHQRGNPARAQTFKAISAFHESMAVASLLAAVAGLAVLAAGPGPLPALLVGAGLAGGLVFRRAYESFDRRFVTEVYHAFYALARDA